MGTGLLGRHAVLDTGVRLETAAHPLAGRPSYDIGLPDATFTVLVIDNDKAACSPAVVEDDVVALIDAGEVGSGVVNDVVGTERRNAGENPSQGRDAGAPGEASER